MAVGIFGNLVDYFIKGGFVMWLLLACSIAGLVIIIERAIFFRRMSVNPQLLFGKVRTQLLERNLQGALDTTGQTPGPLSDVLKAGLLRFGRPHEEIIRAIESVSLHEVSRLERGLWIMATVANVAPLLGFLGTVTGMIDSFGVLGSVGFGDPKLVAKGIAEALITTATGLMIAFPVQLAYNLFTTRVNNFVLLMETTSAMLLETFAEIEEEPKPRS
ncbi:MAG TPA: MotA/TolQ/ExbB proton channel family protein [Acidobacteriota bacterium]|nr:MotA/TolQ/ExbB proton channel family protein [Acidobacteriota bacterium]HQF87660.1 MotA/TolQ/ExbB proton channel family protein [Acidobacteriota bacterium]HQG92665.1 MotA/TolQ/ExbB proton channel family protein [Acidobacteriota bacterium]HQK87574.1 MotA/TolQ/ExbB proton channel family protein [Acidobacteriota bacterium]